MGALGVVVSDPDTTFLKTALVKSAPDTFAPVNTTLVASTPLKSALGPIRYVDAVFISSEMVIVPPILE